MKNLSSLQTNSIPKTLYQKLCKIETSQQQFLIEANGIRNEFHFAIEKLNETIENKFNLFFEEMGNFNSNQNNNVLNVQPIVQPINSNHEQQNQPVTRTFVYPESLYELKMVPLWEILYMSFTSKVHKSVVERGNMSKTEYNKIEKYQKEITQLVEIVRKLCPEIDVNLNLEFNNPTTDTTEIVAYDTSMKKLAQVTELKIMKVLNETHANRTNRIRKRSLKNKVQGVLKKLREYEICRSKLSFNDFY